MSSDEVRPFLIKKDDEGAYRLTVRDTHYNSRGYPIVTSALQTEAFVTFAKARAFAVEHFQAKAGQFATK